MISSLLDSFTGPLKRALSTLARMETSIEYSGPPEYGPGMLSVRIEFQGDFKGYMDLGANYPTASALAGRMETAGTAETSEEEILAAFAELANIVAGNALGELSRKGLKANIGTPIINPIHRVRPGVGVAFARGVTESGAVHLSLASEAPEKPEGKRSEANSGPQKRILVVDDSPYIQKSLAGMLERLGCVVAAKASNGLEAVRLYREISPDLVTLDLVMPQMGGMQTLQLIKRLDPNAKVVIVSSLADQSKIVECMRLGAVHYILKPFEEEAIGQMVARFLG